MAYEFHPDAERELEDATAFYDSISLELGNGFITEVELTINRIEQYPEAWSQLSNNIRRCRIASFPYGIVYSNIEEKIFIIAVMHLQRKPNYWSDRISQE
ncbi:type II toxin-antitoxin system RelE/ParE family toxin [Aetokthonos hydrillicola Thurmond2011]|jgi:plasmid stabilization system protein ParE|uniref:Type II toxin-antitoxin system RelE/ParE family toxin n=1 Tax=Aetokthonos hydrillicola Thurmond2011 TaxID=2712845 RepID=A0AAP5IHB5_9CYAN|nr:type II toxin-antitoxin system RelE/ParE family toxin [Aetokthonos hydrillicola]MBO3457236.1 type II toxin-antitoxin system RelE/ParE family toxin [Aetokthonos hydrillicola CCALA 1050]MBW4587586.1 type II toxin-antitoxin system RelE/ParE family toxin [Aetokthonos hydrillicola CCALA 1050]MDR9900148.1 type II toxin-antitoxin system RelE/ParE family toxin [Aetokthonos hydrillicola Thurmond2011]